MPEYITHSLSMSPITVRVIFSSQMFLKDKYRFRKVLYSVLLLSVSYTQLYLQNIAQKGAENPMKFNITINNSVH